MLQWNTKVTAILATVALLATRLGSRQLHLARAQLHLVTSRPRMRGRAHPPARLLAVVAPVSLVGLTAYAVATVAFARDPGSATTIAGVGAFLLASTLAERFPVPVEGADANGVSLGFVFAARRPRPLRLGAGDVRLRDRADARRARPAKPVHPHDLQRRRVWADRRPGRLGTDAVPRRHIGRGRPVARRDDRGDPVHRQPRARQRGDRSVRLGDPLPRSSSSRTRAGSRCRSR